jgi:hypothetical protein
MRRGYFALAAICGCADVLGLGEFGDKDASAVDGSDATFFDAPSEAAAEAEADADASCVSATVNETSGIFVATSGSTDSSTCGTMTVPCASIQTGLDRAHVITGKSIVYVARGTYAEAITLYAGLTLEGGWDVLDNGQSKTWVQACADRAGAVIVKPTTSARTIQAIDLGGKASIADITIESKNAGAGESLYGIFARGVTTELVLDDVVVIASSGGDGTPGASGASGDAGSSGCMPDLGDAGAAGSPGSGAEAGVFGSDGFQTWSGTGGTNGTAGLAGAVGLMGECVACGQCKSFIGCSFNTGGQSCGGTGFAGCGGAAGGAGTSGSGGGSSVAIFAWDAKVTATNCDVRAGSGGAGGNGGASGSGGAGGPGATGDAGASCTVGCTGSCNAISGMGAGGDAGSAGGSGGSGGVGGGGSGGCAFALYQGGDASITATTTTLTHGDAGAGGGPISAAGAPGAAGDHFP